MLTRHLPASAALPSRDAEAPFEFCYLDYVFSNIRAGAPSPPSCARVPTSTTYAHTHVHLHTDP
jgi:hypothetical protein